MLDNKRDWNHLLLGFLLAWVGLCVWWIRDPNNQKYLKAKAAKFVKVYDLGCFSLQFHVWDHKPPNGKRLFPQLHPGGAKSDQAKDWAYTELICNQGLTPTNAWFKFLETFPEFDYPDKALLEADKERFISAMKYRRKKAKKGEKTRSK